MASSACRNRLQGPGRGYRVRSLATGSRAETAYSRAAAIPGRAD